MSSQLPARFLLLFGILPAVISIGSAFASETQVPMHERRNHWAYQPVQTGAVPSVKNPAWCADEIDAFILAKLEGNGLVPAAPADRRTLIRRATYDLLGLPPTPEETDDFLRDASPDAFAKAVDRLLASPRYGERWARHWLDLVRFSETLGFEFDFDLYHSWRYRDYVIRAFNSDLPYNRFVLEHLAGDLVADPRREPVEGYDESIIATGFFWMGEGRQTPVDIRQEQADVVDGQIDVLGKAFLGQTIACARCHDHKFDAISTQDYYALAGYLKSSRFQQAFIDPPDRITAKARQLEMLKTRIRQRITDEVAVTWIEEATHASRYLLAVQKVMNAARTAGTPALQPASGDVSDPRVPALGDKNALEPADRSVGITAATPAPLSSLKPRAKEVAPEFGLDEVRLERWIKALEQPELMEAEHPLYAWARLGNQVDEVDNPFSKRRQDLLLALHNQERRAALGAESVCTFERFDKTSFDGWHTTGTAFVSGPAQPGDFLLGDRHHHPVAQFVSRGAHSALLSRRLQGELRSETFTITRPYVHCLVAGQRSRLNLIIDGYLLLMNPMYGGLTVAPTNDLPSWRTIAVDRWIGHRAYFEISDSSLPTYRLNPPPSTGRVPEGPTDGYIEVRQICFSDERTPPPAPPNRVNLLALEQALGDNAQALAAAYETLIVQQLGAWRTGGQSPSNDLSEHGVALLNWLVENGLLDIPAPTLHEPPGRSRRRTEADQLKSKIQNPKSEIHKLAALLDEYRKIEASLPSPLRTPALADGTGEDEFVFLRGNYKTPGERVARRPPTVISSSECPAPSKGSGRLELAQRLVDPSNPLIARVLVNRLWQHHFGEGLVRTPDDFGRMGQPPTHPELLDYLAAEFVRRGWSIKAIHRLMMLSSAYRMSGRPDPAQLQRDPENRLLHYRPVRRLEAEAIRDAILAVSGHLNRTAHGDSTLPHLTPYMEGRGRPNSGPLDGDGRRTIYINARRNFPVPMLVAFDLPIHFSTQGRREVSAVPEQAMTLMNDPFVVQQAERWASRALSQPGGTQEQRINALYQAAFTRPPNGDELRNALDFLRQQAGRHGCNLDDTKVWADLCHVLINVKEFIFIH